MGMNQFMTINAFLMGLTQFLFAGNFIYSLFAGPVAGDNPWHANSLEWSTTSPPPHYNFARIPTVYHPPYEYSVPGVKDDYLPQVEPMPPGIVLDPVMA
jgi:cytochrome c oxidase subunit 1